MSLSALTKLALVGTERQPVVLPAGAGALGAALAQVSATVTEPAPALLAAAAVLGQHQRAGWQAPPLPATVLPPPCPGEVWPACPPAVETLLRRLLQGEFALLLPTALGDLAARQWRLPHATLVAALKLAAKETHLRPAIQAVLGQRGPWLAAQSPAWSFAVAGATVPEADWDTGERAARLALLKHLRATDPARGLALVTRTWSTDGGDERAAFVDALGTGLSAADEPLLEGALDDKRQAVRQAAARALLRLPNSALVQRLTARLAQYLKVASSSKVAVFGLKLGTKHQLEVTLPEECDKALLRDGIELKTRLPVATGEKAGWLLQLVMRVPPAAWAQASGLAPSDLLTLAQGTDWAALLAHGWCASAVLHRDAAWADALLADASVREQAWGQAGALLALLPEEARMARYLQLGQTDPKGFTPGGLAQQVLWELPGPWSAAFSEALLARMRRHLSDPKQAFYYALTDLALRLHPAVLPDAAALIQGTLATAQAASTNDTAYMPQEPLHAFLAAVQFRRDWQQALTA